MTKYKLTYFDIRGLGEAARLIFHYAGVEFEDCRLKWDGEDWHKLKPKTPFGQLPLLEVDGRVIAQSAAIYRYLGRQFGLVPKDPLEEAEVDAIHDAYRDFSSEIYTFIHVCGGTEKGDKEQLFKSTVIPAREKFFPQLEKFLAKAGSGFLVGKSVTWADFAIFDRLFTFGEFAPQLFDGHPEVKKFVDHIGSLPNIQKYLSERPKDTI